MDEEEDVFLEIAAEDFFCEKGQFPSYEEALEYRRLMFTFSEKYLDAAKEIIKKRKERSWIAKRKL